MDKYKKLKDYDHEDEDPYGGRSLDALCDSDSEYEKFRKPKNYNTGDPSGW